MTNQKETTQAHASDCHLRTRSIKYTPLRKNEVLINGTVFSTNNNPPEFLKKRAARWEAQAKAAGDTRPQRNEKSAAKIRNIFDNFSS